MINPLKLMCLADEVTFQSENVYPLTISANSHRYLNDYSIYGNSVQEGTPSPDVPIQVQSVGDLVTDGTYAGKYKIPVTVTSGDTVKTTDIYLDAPLRKIGSYTDYIDFKHKKVIRQVFAKVFTGDEAISVRYANSSTTRFSYSFANRVAGRVNMLCSHFPALNSVYLDSGTEVGVAGSSSSGTVFMRVVGSVTNQEYSQWLKEQYNSGTPVVLYFCVSGDNIVEEKVILPSVLQFKGETIYQTETAISPSGIQVKYY